MTSRCVSAVLHHCLGSEGRSLYIPISPFAIRGDFPRGDEVAIVEHARRGYLSTSCQFDTPTGGNRSIYVLQGGIMSR